MRYGYSMLLREFVEAEEVEIGDCERFQVTCPACREAVFKKSRSRPDGGITHFLSHYRADSADEKDCELRVDAIASEQLAPFTAEGRGQTLDAFMSLLQDAVIRAQEPLYPPGAMRQRLDRLLARPALDRFAVYVRMAAERLLRLPNTRETVSSMLGSFPRFGDMSPFWHRRQASYVIDVLRHLLSPAMKRNMRVVSALAILNVGDQADGYRRNRAELVMPDIGYDPIPAVEILEALVNGKSEDALRKMVFRVCGPPDAPQTERTRALESLQNAMVGELIGPIVGVLGAVPWPELARNRNASLPLPPSLAKIRELLEAILRL